MEENKMEENKNTPTPTQEEKELTGRFMQFVMMQAENILYLLGRVQGPDGSTPPPNLKAAKMLVDQLEMIETKTKNNLNDSEEKALHNVLSNVKLAFVEISGGVAPSMMPSSVPPELFEEEEKKSPEPQKEKSQENPHADFPENAPSSTTAPTSDTPETTPAPEEKKKKFFKRYD